ncbi:hypothetical protein ACPA9J_04055 [Pseudomonas aeruginosa]
MIRRIPGCLACSSACKPGETTQPSLGDFDTPRLRRHLSAGAGRNPRLRMACSNSDSASGRPTHRATTEHHPAKPSPSVPTSAACVRPRATPGATSRCAYLTRHDDRQDQIVPPTTAAVTGAATGEDTGCPGDGRRTVNYKAAHLQVDSTRQGRVNWRGAGECQIMRMRPPVRRARAGRSSEMVQKVMSGYPPR